MLTLTPWKDLLTLPRIIVQSLDPVAHYLGQVHVLVLDQIHGMVQGQGLVKGHAMVQGQLLGKMFEVVLTLLWWDIIERRYIFSTFYPFILFLICIYLTYPPRHSVSPVGLFCRIINEPVHVISNNVAFW